MVTRSEPDATSERTAPSALTHADGEGPPGRADQLPTDLRRGGPNGTGSHLLAVIKAEAWGSRALGELFGWCPTAASSDQAAGGPRLGSWSKDNNIDADWVAGAIEFVLGRAPLFPPLPGEDPLTVLGSVTVLAPTSLRTRFGVIGARYIQAERTSRIRDRPPTQDPLFARWIRGVYHASHTAAEVQELTVLMHGWLRAAAGEAKIGLALAQQHGLGPLELRVLADAEPAHAQALVAEPVAPSQLTASALRARLELLED